MKDDNKLLSVCEKCSNKECKTRENNPFYKIISLIDRSSDTTKSFFNDNNLVVKTDNGVTIKGVVQKTEEGMIDIKSIDPTTFVSINVNRIGCCNNPEIVELFYYYTMAKFLAYQSLIENLRRLNDSLER